MSLLAEPVVGGQFPLVAKTESRSSVNYSIRRIEGFRLRRWAWRVYATNAAPPVEGVAWTSLDAKLSARAAVAVIKRRGLRSFHNAVLSSRVALVMGAIAGLTLVVTEPAAAGHVGMVALNVAVEGVAATTGVVAEGISTVMPKSMKKKKKGKKGKKGKGGKGGKSKK